MLSPMWHGLQEQDAFYWQAITDYRSRDNAKNNEWLCVHLFCIYLFIYLFIYFALRCGFCDGRGQRTLVHKSGGQFHRDTPQTSRTKTWTLLLTVLLESHNYDTFDHQHSTQAITPKLWNLERTTCHLILTFLLFLEVQKFLFVVLRLVQIRFHGSFLLTRSVLFLSRTPDKVSEVVLAFRTT